MSDKRNVGVIDRVIRLGVSGALFYFALYFPATANDSLSFFILLAMALINTVAALIGICPVYMALGIRTNRNAEEGV